MECPRLDRKRLDIADMGDPQPVLADGLDVFRPRIDIGHVFAGLHHMGPGITTDRPGADDRYLFLCHHVFSHIRFAARLAAHSALDPSTTDLPASSYRFGRAGFLSRRRALPGARGAWG